MRESISGEKKDFLSEFAKLFDVLNSEVDVGSLLGCVEGCADNVGCTDKEG